ncbi:SCO2522 family protein [Actinomadura sp. WMMA1423]|uniref:SCO2522 family protein n=1 Tax=Actinomadura sp. WMMA1423 TaxID=2591108 RepID=UPI001147798F|nr:SCO2522 family protein [Actinomadura sp. WMMA1423]
MTEPELEVDVLTSQPRVELVPRSHLSLELGHLYMEDLLDGPETLRRHFGRIGPWADFVRARYPAPLRISTCFLVDDYFSQLTSPKKLVPELLDAAHDAGFGIDYLVRESACASAGEVSPAELVLGRIVSDPPQGSNGLRPPVHLTGWVSNSRDRLRPDGLDEALATRPWHPPEQNGARTHGICMEVQIWDERDGRRRWSCAMLSAVWQLLRLGLLRHQGKPVVSPTRWTAEYPERWEDLPPLVQLADGAQPFAAFRTMSLLQARFADVEAAVRTILDQVFVDPAVTEQTAAQAAAQKVDLPGDVVGRISHVFGAGF